MRLSDGTYLIHERISFGEQVINNTRYFFELKIYVEFDEKTKKYKENHHSIDFDGIERMNFGESRKYLSHEDAKKMFGIPSSAYRNQSSLKAFLEKRPDLGKITPMNFKDIIDRVVTSYQNSYDMEEQRKQAETRKNAFMEDLKALLKKHNAVLSGSVYAPYEEASGGVDIKIGDDPSFEILDLKDGEDNIFQM